MDTFQLPDSKHFFHFPNADAWAYATTSIFEAGRSTFNELRGSTAWQGPHPYFTGLEIVTINAETKTAIDNAERAVRHRCTLKHYINPSDPRFENKYTETEWKYFSIAYGRKYLKSCPSPQEPLSCYRLLKDADTDHFPSFAYFVSDTIEHELPHPPKNQARALSTHVRKLRFNTSTPLSSYLQCLI